jgi:hypothetical protein
MPLARDPESMNLNRKVGSFRSGDGASDPVASRHSPIDSGSRASLVRSGRPATLSEAYTSAFGMHDETAAESTESVVGGFLRRKPKLCAHCLELLAVRICWVCLTRRPVPGKTMCRRCQNAMDALSRYWRDIGQPLTWRE